MIIKIVDKKEFTDNICKIQELYEKCFGAQLTQEEIIWRYINNPQGDILACFIYDEGQLVSYYAAVPININKIGKSALSLNTMTHPEYTGRGLFVKAAERLYDYLIKKNYQCIIGFPNGISNRTFINKLEWEDIYEVPTLVYEINRESINRYHNSSILDDSQWEKDYSYILEYNHDSTKNTITKGLNYYQWRYRDCPTYQYRNIVISNEGVVNAFFVCKKYNEILNIIDYQCTKLDYMQEFIKYITNNDFFQDIHTISTWAQINTKEHLLLEKLGFKNCTPVTYFAGRTFNKNIEIKDYKSWNIKMGDNNSY